MEQYLRSYTNYQQDNWSSLLLLSKFAYNNAANETMGVSPFFANKGYHPNLAVEPNTLVPSAEPQQFIAELDELHNELKENISQAQRCYQKYVDQCRLPPPTLRVSNHVYIKAKYFCTTQPSRKLAKKNLGPFEIISIPGTLSFTLRLPDQFQSVHPVFHVSQLEPTTKDPFPQ